MSESKKELLKPMILAIMSASLLGTLVYYFVPQNTRFITVAFALGGSSEISGNYSTLFIQELGLNATFLNGSVIQVYRTGGESTPSGVTFPEGHSGEINATQLKKIKVFVTGGVSLEGKGSLEFLVWWAQNRTINTALVAEETKDMGSSKTVGVKMGVASSSSLQEKLWHEGSFWKEFWEELWKELNVNVTEKTSTGYWNVTDFAWEIDLDRLGSMLHGSNPADITFTLDISMNLKYKVMTSYGDITGDAELQWSGTWGTLQLLHEADKILIVRYDFSNIKLNMIAA